MDIGKRDHLFDIWDAETLKVSAPIELVLVCGGTTDKRKNPNALTRRDAFMQICALGELAKYTFVRAEDINPLASRVGYRDWLTFELDISQLVHIVLLFCESPGSYAELGSFVMDEDIRERLLAIVDDTAHAAETYTSRGPLDYLEDLFPSTAVLVVKTNEINQGPATHQTDIDFAAFRGILEPALRLRARESRDNRTFNPSKTGHIIKLMTGIIQDYGALKEEEILFIMEYIGHKISRDTFIRFVECAIMMGWVHKDRRNLTTFYTAASSNDAIRFKYKGGKVRDRSRWRLDVLQHWKVNDAERYASIQRGRST